MVTALLVDDPHAAHATYLLRPGVRAKLVMMLGQLTRARRQLSRNGHEAVVVAFFTAYKPRAVAGVLGTGFALAGGFGGAASTGGTAAWRVHDWGERESRTTIPMPSRVLVAVTDQHASVYAWHATTGLGKQVVQWLPGEFTASSHHRRWLAQVDLRIRQRDHRMALLTGKWGRTHPSATGCAQALLALAHAPHP